MTHKDRIPDMWNDKYANVALLVGIQDDEKLGLSQKVFKIVNKDQVDHGQSQDQNEVNFINLDD